MVTGYGFSIGTVHVVAARVRRPRSRHMVCVRRTAAGAQGSVRTREGEIRPFGTTITEFADIARDSEPVSREGRIWTPAGMVSAIVERLLSEVQAETSDNAPVETSRSVFTHPAHYTDEHLGRLRQALETSGIEDLVLVPEPIAALAGYGHLAGTPWPSPRRDEYVLVYDLGGTSLDVSIVHLAPASANKHQQPDFSLVGRPVRSREFGSQPLSALLNRWGAGPEQGRRLLDADRLRSAHIRDSVDVVREALRAAHVSLSHIDRILLVGGATRAPEVAETLSELSRPLYRAPHPEHHIALGAAYLAADKALHHPAPLFSVA